MTWVLDQDLGDNAGTLLGPTITLTLPANVASGAWIYIGVGWFHVTNTLTGITDSVGGLTYSIVGTIANNSGAKAVLYKVLAPAGRASGTVITATFDNDAPERKIAAASFTGGDGTTENATTNTGTGTSVSVAPTATAGALVVGFAALDTASTFTQDGNTTELADFQAPGASTAALMYRTTGTTVGGTWGASAAWAAAAGSFTDSAAATTSSARRRSKRARGAAAPGLTSR